jgi:hypothetical protein
MSQIISVRTIHETQYDQWSGFVATCASGSIYALPDYLEILCEATGGSYSILGVYREDELIGGCPCPYFIQCKFIGHIEVLCAVLVELGCSRGLSSRSYGGLR